MLKQSLIAFLATSAIGTAAIASDALPSFDGFKGELEAGASFQSGNTDSTELHLGAKGEQELNNWRHHFDANAYNSKQNGTRNDEEYRLGFGSDWKMNERDYLYGQIGYVNDRYAGFNYRITESIGVGRRWADDGVYLLDTRVGPGLRHTKFTTGDKEDSWIILGGLLAGWKINDHVELGEEATVEYSPDGTIFNSSTFLKSKLTEVLSFKAGFDVEHKTEVPTGLKKTDTRTTAGIVYGF
ncbi:MAG: DUF481 domain-containing protein [Rickettsiales bacterium]|nr:DUF481 domain-containing protein [Rickettsiales bacterium]